MQNKKPVPKKQSVFIALQNLLGKYKTTSKYSNCIKKVTKNSKNNFVFVLVSKFRGISPYATWDTTGGSACTFSVMCCDYKEGTRVAGNTLNGGWGMKWWRDVDGVEGEGWAVGVGEDGNVGLHKDVTGDRSGRLDCGWNVSWDECGNWDDEDTEFGEVMNWVRLVDDMIRSCFEQWEKHLV